MHHFSRKYCIMTSLYRRSNVFDVILSDKGRNSVEQNAIAHDNSDRSLLRPQAPLLQSPNVVNQWISKDRSCDALIIYDCAHEKMALMALTSKRRNYVIKLWRHQLTSPPATRGGNFPLTLVNNVMFCLRIVFIDFFGLYHILHSFLRSTIIFHM